MRGRTTLFCSAVFLVWTKSRTGAKNLDHTLRQYGDKTLTKDCPTVENAEITLQNTVGKKKSCKQKKTYALKVFFLLIIFSINMQGIKGNYGFCCRIP